MASESEYVGVGEAARLLGVHENTVRNWVKTGVLASARLPGTRQHRFLRPDLERLLRDQGADASSRVESLKAFGPELVGANDLDAWTGRFAQENFPEMVRRLLANTAGATNVSVRAGDGISAPGFDGISTVNSTGSFLPAGVLIMEMGTDADPVRKAQREYAKRVEELGGSKSTAHFVFLTPRRWRNAADWQQKKTAEGHFASVRVLDADDLEGWLKETPFVHIWLSELFGRKPSEVETIGRWWEEFAAQTNPELPVGLFAAGREEAVGRVRSFLEANVRPEYVLRVKAAWRDEVIGFLASVVPRSADASIVLIHSKEAWGRVLTDSRVPLVAIPMFAGANLALAEDRKHRVIIPVTPQDSLRNDNSTVELPRLSAGEASQALQEAGVGRDRSTRLATLARRSMRAFVRELARDERGLMPEWALSDDRRAIANLVLVQQWTNREDDQDVLTRLTSATPDDLESLLSRWERHEDPPFIRSGSAWRVAAPLEAAFALLPLLTSADLSRWSEIAAEVLTEPDPTAGMSETERLMAPLNGVQRRYSSILREGIADGLALVGQTVTVGSRNESGSEIASRVARDLLECSDIDQEKKAWVNLSPYLQSIAEGAPELFLEYVDQDLRRPNPLLQSLFETSGNSGIFSATSPHVYLLWALEILAQSADYFFRSAEALSQLVPFDAALGNTSNRASESLRVLLLPWIRQTDAPLATRLSFLRSWRNRDDASAWPILLKLLPGGHDFAMMPASPKYRDWSPQQQTVPLAEWSEFVEHLANLVLESAGWSLDKWADLISPLSSLPVALRTKFLFELDAAVQATVSGDSDESHDKLYEALRDEIGRHREFPDADWALTEEDLSQLEGTLSQLSPSAPANEYRYLFGWHPHLEGFSRHAAITDDAAAYASELERQRRSALRVTAGSGPEALRELIQIVEVPQHLGMMLADELSLVDVPTILQWLEHSGSNAARAASAYVFRRSEHGDVDWVMQIFQSDVREAAKDLFAASLAPKPLIWALLEEVGHSHAHWANMNPYAVAPEDRSEAISGLIGAGRAEATLSLIELSIQHEPQQELESDLILRAIKALLEVGTTPLQTHSGYSLSTILQHLRTQGVPDEILAPLEFILFRVLSDTQHGTSSLFRVLETNPEEFVHLVETAFRAKSPARSADTKDGNPSRAALAYEVLSEWRSIPGTMENGSVDGQALKDWVERARLLLSASDRADIGDEMIGQLLSAGGSFAPEGWPAPGVAEVIETTASVALESGLHIGLTNGRGVTVRDPFDGGKQEHELAQRFNLLSVASQAWSRTSRVLKAVAGQYERRALEEDRRAQWLGDEG